MAEYKLRSFKDVWEQIPGEHLERCLKEITTCLLLARKRADLLQEIGRGEKYPITFNCSEYIVNDEERSQIVTTFTFPNGQTIRAEATMKEEPSNG